MLYDKGQLNSILLYITLIFYYGVFILSIYFIIVSFMKYFISININILILTRYTGFLTNQ